jgi:thymidylate synthase (FAD)
MAFYIPNDSLYQNDMNVFSSQYRAAVQTYENLLAKGYKPETARSVLPVGLFTEFYWNVDARNLMHFLDLRLDKHAQKEIRLYAKRILELFKTAFPILGAVYETSI